MNVKGNLKQQFKYKELFQSNYICVTERIYADWKKHRKI